MKRRDCGAGVGRNRGRKANSFSSDTDYFCSPIAQQLVNADSPGAMDSEGNPACSTCDRTADICNDLFDD